MLSTLFKRLPLFFSALAMVLFISCKDEKKDTPATETSETAEETINDTQNKSTNSSTKNDGEVALNPPHGQPGHRCDVQVGQPLPTGNSPQKSPVINSTQKSPVINNSGSVPVNNSNSTAKVNPPHGQPGHSCDIPVGAPLE